VCGKEEIEEQLSSVCKKPHDVFIPEMN